MADSLLIRVLDLWDVVLMGHLYHRPLGPPLQQGETNQRAYPVA